MHPGRCARSGPSRPPSRKGPVRSRPSGRLTRHCGTERRTLTSQATTTNDASHKNIPEHQLPRSDGLLAERFLATGWTRHRLAASGTLLTSNTPSGGAFDGFVVEPGWPVGQCRNRRGHRHVRTCLEQGAAPDTFGSDGLPLLCTAVADHRGGSCPPAVAGPCEDPSGAVRAGRSAVRAG